MDFSGVPVPDPIHRDRGRSDEDRRRNLHFSLVPPALLFIRPHRRHPPPSHAKYPRPARNFADSRTHKVNSRFTLVIDPIPKAIGKRETHAKNHCSE